jgi:hypothetical protein
MRLRAAAGAWASSFRRLQPARTTEPRQIVTHDRPWCAIVEVHIEHDPSGVDWALFLNRTVSRETDRQVHREFVSGMRDAIAKTSAWPRRDLFAQYPDRF